MPDNLTPDQIIELRRRLQLSQTAFAALINSKVDGLAVNTPTVCRWETGKHHPSPVTSAVIRRLMSE